MIATDIDNEVEKAIELKERWEYNPPRSRCCEAPIVRSKGATSVDICSKCMKSAAPERLSRSPRRRRWLR